MTDLKKIFFTALLTTLAVPLVAQEPWDVHFKLTAGSMNKAEENQIGQNKVYGVAIAGMYPLTLRGSGVLEGGYKVFPTTSVSEGASTVIDDLTDAFFAGLLYRHELWRNGIYLQGGLRMTNARTVRDIISKGMGENGKDMIERVKADRVTKTGWCFAVGYRLTDLLSLEIGASSAGFKNLSGVAVNGTIVEVALCIHR